jgi:hypothetical protein
MKGYRPCAVKKIIVPKSKEVKPGCDLAECSKERRSSKKGCFASYGDDPFGLQQKKKWYTRGIGKYREFYN